MLRSMAFAAVLAIVPAALLAAPNSDRLLPTAPEAKPAPEGKPGAKAKPGPKADRPPQPGPATQPAPPGGFTGGQQLKPRELTDKPIDEKAKKRYETSRDRIKARADGTSAAPRASSSRAPAASKTPSILPQVAACFELGNYELRNGQEVAAQTAYRQGWEKLVESWPSDAKQIPRTLPTTSKHIKDMSALAGNDPALLLALMKGLSDTHKQAMEAVKDQRVRRSFATPLAVAWGSLMGVGPLEPESAKVGIFWVLQAPEAVMVNRRLTPAEEQDMRAALAQAVISGSQTPAQPTPGQLTGLLDRLIAGQEANQPVQFGAQPGTARFMEAGVAVRFGQYADALPTFRKGWNEFFDQAKADPQSVGPGPVRVELGAIEQAVRANPAVAIVLMTQLDPMHRNVAASMPPLATTVAEMWLRLAEVAQELPGPTLATAVFWGEAASRNGAFKTQHQTQLETLKQRLEAWKAANPTARVGDDDDEDDDDDRRAGKKDDDKDDDDDKPGAAEDREDKDEQKAKPTRPTRKPPPPGELRHAPGERPDPKDMIPRSR